MLFKLSGAFILELSLSSIFIRVPFVGQGFLDLAGQGLSAWDSWSSLRQTGEV